MLGIVTPSNTMSSERSLTALVLWRVIVAVGLIGYGVVMVFGQTDTDGPMRWTLAATALAAGAVSVAAAVHIRRRRHRGRAQSLILDSLIVTVVGFVAINRMGLFTGIDAVAEAFNKSFGWLGVVGLGSVVAGVAARTGQTGLQRVARWVMIAGGAVLVLGMGLLPGLLELARRMITANVWPLLVVMAVAIWSVRFVWSHQATAVFRSTQVELEAMDGFLFAAPNVLGFLAFFAGPLAVSLFISFTEWDGLTDATFVGFDNYIALASDDLFLISLRNILVFGAVAIPIAVMTALFLAALLNSDIPGVKFFRAVYFLPSIAGVVGVTLIWKQLFNSTVGYLNFVILKATEAFNAVAGSDLTAAQPQWISDSSIALFAVIILFAWQQIGFNTVLFLAGMQGIDRTLYEAADIDGAGAWTRFRSITIPMLRPTTVFVVATTTILALQMFNEPFILQSPSTPAGPNNSTLTPVVYLYQNAFQQFEIGYASAVAWALFILIFGITLLYFRRTDEDGVLSA